MGPVGEGLGSGDQGSARRSVNNRWASILLTHNWFAAVEQAAELAVGQMSMEIYLTIFVLFVDNLALLEAKTPLVIGKLHKDKFCSW